jgi:hypothetical protein
MAISYITNANTFAQWLAATQSLITAANNLTDGPTFTACTELRLTKTGVSLNVTNHATIGGNLTVNTAATIATANISILNVTGSANALYVANSAVITKNVFVNDSATVNNDINIRRTIYTTGSGETMNVSNTATFKGNVLLTGSGTSLNVSNNVYIGGDLIVSGNVTLDVIGYDELVVGGNTSIAGGLIVTGNTTMSNATVANTLTANIASITSANITSFVGTANDAIYSAISTVDGNSIAVAIALG